jgi:hypothetical protein
MMEIGMKNVARLVIALMTTVAIGQQAQEPGIYADQGGTLLALSPAAYSGTQSSNSVVKASVSWTFRGSRSTVQLSTNRPHFRLICGHRGAVPLILLCGTALQPSDLIIVRLDEKSDHRESRMATGSMFGGHGGFDPKKTTTATATASKNADGSWDVVPDKELKPGEYLITTGIQPQGFDFGVQSGAK